MLICHCYAVYDRAVDQAITDGARTIPDLADATDAGAGCGGCHLALCRRLGAAHPEGECGGDACSRSTLATSLAGCRIAV